MTISGDVAGGNIITLRFTQITTGGGDYAAGNNDKRQGAFVSGSTIQGDVIGQQTVVRADLSRHDRDNRQRMLAHVHTFWIEGVLEQSLYRELLIALNLQIDPQAVSFTGPSLATRRDQGAHLLPAGTSVAQVYADAHRRLLILGAPGAGKTTLLLELARHLLIEARRDETRPIPVIFNLSSWAQQRLPLHQWLVQELRDQYGLSRRLAQQWLDANHVLPLLDGLDEVAEPQRAACVAAINAFMEEHGAEGLVVYSRVADYQAIGARLRLDTAVQVQPLDDAQIAQYLAWAGEPLAGVRAVLNQDGELRELARAPFMLNILALTYEGQRPEELLGSQAAAQQHRLFGSYVRRVFDRPARSDPQRYTQDQRPARSDPQRYTQDQTVRWLRWLAARLVQDSQTIFQIELMQPWWLRRWWQRGLYVLGATVGAGAGGALFGALFGVVLGLLVGLGLEAMLWAFPEAVRTAAISGLEAQGDGLALGLALGLVGGLGVSLLQRAPARRRPWHTRIWGRSDIRVSRRLGR